MSSSDDFGFTFTFLRNKEFLNDKINEIDKKIMQTYFLDCTTIVNKSKQFVVLSNVSTSFGNKKNHNMTKANGYYKNSNIHFVYFTRLIASQLYDIINV
jgi:hypothetical protein